MMKSLTILDPDYLKLVQDIVSMCPRSQIKAAIKVNVEQLKFNWLLGRDIVEMKVEERWGEGVIEQLSKDLKREMPGVEGLSATNLRYCRRFYLLYSDVVAFRPQDEGEIFNIPWGHHKLLLDKGKRDLNKALYYIAQTTENGWSRAMLQGWIDTDLYERSGIALTNFTKSMHEVSSDLAQELTRDPYVFAFTGIDFGAYVGGWYEQYYDKGVNWASPDYMASSYFPSWATKEYESYGIADLLDVQIIGAYASYNGVYGSSEWTMQGFCRLAKQKTKGAPVLLIGGPDVGNWNWDGNATVNAELTAVTNFESFDRDMPIRFLPIKWEKLLLKMEMARKAGMEGAITFEFSHFMSPNSEYSQAGHLYDRYCEHFGIRNNWKQ